MFRTSAAPPPPDSARLVGSWRAGMFSLPDDCIPCPGIIWREPGPSGREGIWLTVRKAMLLFVDE